LRIVIRSLLASTIISVALIGSAAGATPEAEQKFRQVCATCHGPQGEGKRELKTPSIASLPAWYVQTQLEKFQKSIRGTAADDVSGQQMHAIAATLTPRMTEAIAGLVSKLPRNPTRNTLKGDLTEGEFIFRDVCMQCHRYNATGELVFKSPPLIGLQDWYIERQLRKFRDGNRGADKRDIKGAKMHLMVNDLSDADLRGVASYISVLAAKQAKPAK